MKHLVEQIGKVRKIHSEPFQLNEPFINFVSRFAQLEGTVALLSGGEHETARYHLLSAKPHFTLVSSLDDTTLLTANNTTTVPCKPFEALQAVLEHCTSPASTDSFGPVASGLFGYQSYDLKNGIETIPNTTIDDQNLPQMVFYSPSILVIYDKLLSVAQLKLIETTLDAPDFLEKTRSFIEEYRSKPLPDAGQGNLSCGKLVSNVSQSEYVKTIEKIRQYIIDGDIYQVNLSHRFEAPFHGSAFDYFRAMYRQNPAPFYAFIQAGNHQIVSTSPERFIRRNGNLVETRPIKGTCPRNSDPVKDNGLKSGLLNSLKDDAELSMIVDLLRNDLGKVCQANSVEVQSHKAIEAYRNVYHLVSTVTGTLSEETTATDLIKALFPGGSITGCPKIRSMEIIDEVEQYRRHIYTGSIGYIGFGDSMDLSIAIRTVTVSDKRLVFSVGGAIVFDSDPEAEYRETLTKGQTMIDTLGPAGDQAIPAEMAWLNGKIVPYHQAAIPIDDLGFQYGFGLFETIRADNGTVRYLEDHIRRFNESWKKLIAAHPPDISWQEVIRQLLAANNLNRGTAAIKLIGTRGDPTTGHPNLVVTVRNYVHRLEITGKNSLVLKSYPHPRQSPLADHKSLNYLFYFQAGHWAKTHEADEAVILNGDQSISETNSANILIIRGKTAIRPQSPHVLPGVTEQIVYNLLMQKGYQVIGKRIFTDEIADSDAVIICNSLVGVVPVSHVDDRLVANSEQLCRELMPTLFPS